MILVRKKKIISLKYKKIFFNSNYYLSLPNLFVSKLRLGFLNKSLSNHITISKRNSYYIL
jgi:hypothetical protein